MDRALAAAAGPTLIVSLLLLAAIQVREILTMTFLDVCLGTLIIAAALSVNMAAAWVAWRVTRNSGWVDTVWTFGLGAIGIASALFLFVHEPASRSWLAAVMAACWSLRLGLHIARRTTGITDDPRYANLIRAWGADAARQMFWLLQKQALVSIPLGVAIWLAARHSEPFPLVTDVMGVAVFVVAVAGEAISDEQLHRFRKNPDNRGRICDAGLWGWSRHPNYFFEWLGWLAYPLLAIDISGNQLWGFLAFGAPACMYWLLVHVSGIPPLEQHMAEKRGDEFRRYRARTNTFFPGPPKTSIGDAR
jgi:steroid 5-alpha reductase family enzyme